MTGAGFPPAVLRAAERVLAEAFGSPVGIVHHEPLTEELSVARCHLGGHADRAGLQGTVIVRTHRSRGGWRTDPSYLVNDYAATRLLNSAGSSACARLIGSNLLGPAVAAGVQVTEDLGTGPSLDDLLAGGSRVAAEAGLLAWARALGELHAATAGRLEEYERLRGSLGSPMPVEHRISLVERPVDAAWTNLAARADEPVTAAVRADVERLVRELREPGRLLALSNGDTCPYNCRITDDRVRFFDFELAGFRSRLLDAAYLRIGFPSCYRWGRLPGSTRDEAELVYRTAAQLDETTYVHGLAGACGAWAITRAERLTPASEPPQVAQVHAVVAAFVEASRAAGNLEALAGWFERLASSWGDARAEPPLFPAFAAT